MISKDLDDFKKRKNVLIFGYGFGYHVREIISFLRKKRIQKFKILF